MIAFGQLLILIGFILVVIGSNSLQQEKWSLMDKNISQSEEYRKKLDEFSKDIEILTQNSSIR